MEPAILLRKIDFLTFGADSHCNDPPDYKEGEPGKQVHPLSYNSVSLESQEQEVKLIDVLGKPSTRTVNQWAELARKAKKIWLQSDGALSRVACVELCYFSTAARWLRVKHKPAMAWIYVHILKNMAYPKKFNEMIERYAGIEKYN